MRSTTLSSRHEMVQFKKMIDFLFIALLFCVAFLVLFYFFHKGAEFAAEVVVSTRAPKPW